MSKGFSNWKDATTILKKHEQSSCHREAVEVTITLPATTRDVGEQLCQEHQKEKETNRKMLLKVISCIRYLARQGLALRGDGDEQDGNFMQLLKLKGEDDEAVINWLKRKVNKYTSHEIQNDLLKVMAMQVSRDVATCLQQSPFFAVMVDETTDVSNREQMTVVVRSTTDCFEVHEDFLGMYQVPSIDASTLTEATVDALCRMNLPLSKLRGQCYDGASSMKGVRSGVAKRILDKESRAIYTHCYGHSINLAVNDALKISKPIKAALETTHEVTKLIKYSPRREGIFRELKSAHDLAAGYHSPGVRVLCPTRWTVNAASLASIIDNYSVLQSTWEEAVDAVRDTESKARINGVAAQMEKFDFLFGASVGEMILRHSDNLSQTLQKKTTSAAEGQQVARMVIETLQTLRIQESYDLFWEKVIKQADSIGIEEPRLPRRRKLPARYDGSASGHTHDTPKAHFRQLYYEALDSTISCLKDRFDQPGYKIYCNLEELLIKASMRDDFNEPFQAVCNFYQDDLNRDLLEAQLVTFGVNFKLDTTSSGQPAKPTIFDIRNHFKALSEAQRTLLSQVSRVLHLVLVMPATNATSERSFSALRRVKTYLRSTMGQERLNSLMLLHVHNERTDLLNLKQVANEFVMESEHRLRMFGKFQ